MRSLIFLLGIFLLADLFSSQSVQACDLCAIYTANRATGQNGKGVNVGVFEQFTRFGTLKQDGHTVDNPLGQYMNSSITQFFGAYAFNRRIAAQLNLPIIVRTYKRPSDTGTEEGSVKGIGDISLIGKFMPCQKQSGNFNFTWHLQGGFKFPTGSSSRLHEELDEDAEDPSVPASGIHGHDLTLGSGSVDGLIGTDLFAQWRRVFVDGNLQYDIRTRGAIDYRFANDLHWSLSPGGYLLLKHTYTLALQGRLSGEYKSLDDLSGAAATDTGINAVYLGPDASFTWRAHLSAALGADFPVFIHNTDFQAVPDYRIRTSVAWEF